MKELTRQWEEMIDMKKMSRSLKIVSSVISLILVLLIGLSFGSKRIYSEVEINAPQEKVWSILSDLESYTQWNPFMTAAHGQLKAGEQIHMKLHNGSLNIDPFDPILLKVKEGVEINWIGRVANIPRLFDGNHHLVIQPMSNGHVKFIQYEDFKGIIVSLTNIFDQSLFNDTHQGYIKMNEALKARAEALR